MLSIAECADYAGVRASEFLIDPESDVRHESLLKTYRLNAWRGVPAVCEIICADLRAAIDLGARSRAVDLLLILRQFLAASDCYKLN